MLPQQSTNETRLDDKIRSGGRLQYDLEDSRDHRDSFVSRVNHDFSNVHVYHADGYIPRERCVFQFRQGNCRHLLLWRMARCTQDGRCWYVRVKIFGRVTKEKIRRWNVVDIVGTKVAKCSISLTSGSILVHQTRHNQAAMDPTHPHDLYKLASRDSRVSVCKDRFHSTSLMTHIRLWMFRLALT